MRRLLVMQNQQGWRVNFSRSIRAVKKLIASLLSNKTGSIAPIMAMMMPVVLGAGGLTMDYAFMRMQSSALQDAADTAALAATQELSVALKGASYLESVVKSYAFSAFPENKDLTVTSSIIGSNTVAVTLSLEWSPFFAQYFGADVTPIVAKAKATLVASDKICVLGLMPNVLAGVHLDNKSKLMAKTCGVYSNSTSVAAIRTDGKATGTASTFCASGGYKSYGQASLYPTPQVDCPVIRDPLANRAKPAIGSCNWNNLVISASKTLSPGTYCGGIQITGTAKVKLNPGVYIIKDGPLLVHDAASFYGKNAGFFLTGPNSIFEFAAGTHIDLAAPETGVLAGLLFYEDQNVDYTFDFNPFALEGTTKAEKSTSDNRILTQMYGDEIPEELRLHKISSNDANELLGTIYLSKSVLLVDANAAVADESAYTALVVGRLWLREGPTLVLNTDYSVTNVPVPAGLAGGHSRLLE